MIHVLNILNMKSNLTTISYSDYINLNKKVLNTNIRFYNEVVKILIT